MKFHLDLVGLLLQQTDPPTYWSAESGGPRVFTVKAEETVGVGLFSEEVKPKG